MAGRQGKTAAEKAGSKVLQKAVVDQPRKACDPGALGECGMNRMVDIISRERNGFAGISPANLMDMFVMDSAGRVRFLLKKGNRTAITAWRSSRWRQKIHINSGKFILIKISQYAIIKDSYEF